MARVVQEVARELSITPAQAALAWTRQRSGVLPMELVLWLETATEFSLGFPADIIAQTRPWVLGTAAV